ncbi:MAG: hypothetical protein Q8R81_09630 [Novosphingobium sp.]|uniref:hypothetical protein n=1 Tax=Novosphingobium sp. TaxID=1874826 RepID=UPI0027346625|nr:hypothetical protein [Novosphingobium sp.]MDP3550645.1 hypothetical protein [Novosphingobium sp.]
MSSVPILYGPDFYSGPPYEREKRHRSIICAKCAPIIVTPERLAECIDWEGTVKSWDAVRLIERLIQEAEQMAVAKTLGLEP